MKTEATTSRSEHLAWCKARALEYVDSGNLTEAFASMASNLKKHPETQNHAGSQLGIKMLVGGHLRTAAKMRELIESFN